MAGSDRVSPDKAVEPGTDDASGDASVGGPVGAADTGVDDAEVVDAEVVDTDVESDDNSSDPSGSSDAGDGAAGARRAQADPMKVVLAERDEYLDSLRRLQAEFENYRKRVTSQQAEQAARAATLLVDKLLPVLDTLDLAVQHLGDADSADGKALVASGNQLHGVLAKEGLERIDPLGEVFDPTAHEAVGHVPAEEGKDEDEDAPVPKPVVAQVMRPGYRWKGAVLRPAMVTVRG
jgi:molecular chaperone GrpE